MYRKEPVIGFEEYQVNTSGVVYSKKGRPLKYSVNPRGYRMVVLCMQGKTKAFAIHTLVAKQFLGEHAPEKNQVNHIDGNKQNNVIDNLEWVTPKENTVHARDVLHHMHMGADNCNARAIVAYDPQTGAEAFRFDSIADAGRYFVKPGKNPRYVKGVIWQALQKQKKTYRGYRWEYADMVERLTHCA